MSGSLLPFLGFVGVIVYVLYDEFALQRSRRRHRDRDKPDGEGKDRGVG